ncbi:hypothetical protein C0Q70_14102 [Pomacea canaliculata]|uniref:Uncharacterized protein n=1 Tax=Pomacea canaliculata TaxID=400727 RepID=A0A2T7NZ36_POMCA|nr:hypothetical protein C0Q70_14102 [Pomacea canaliculata]
MGSGDSSPTGKSQPGLRLTQEHMEGKKHQSEDQAENLPVNCDQHPPLRIRIMEDDLHSRPTMDSRRPKKTRPPKGNLEKNSGKGDERKGLDMGSPTAGFSRSTSVADSGGGLVTHASCSCEGGDNSGQALMIALRIRDPQGLQFPQK